MFIIVRGSAVNTDFIKKITIVEWEKVHFFYDYFAGGNGDTHFVFAKMDDSPSIEHILYSGTEDDCHIVFRSIVREISTGRAILGIDEPVGGK